MHRKTPLRAKGSYIKRDILPETPFSKIHSGWYVCAHMGDLEICQIWIRWVQREREELGSFSGNLLEGKWEGDWPLRRTSVLPFLTGSLCTSTNENYLKGWLLLTVVESCGHVARGLVSGGLIGLRRQLPVRKQNVIWAISWVSRITGILFFACKVNILSHFYHEPPWRPHQWTLN